MFSQTDLEPQSFSDCILNSAPYVAHCTEMQTSENVKR